MSLKQELLNRINYICDFDCLYDLDICEGAVLNFIIDLDDFKRSEGTVPMEITPSYIQIKRRGWNTWTIRKTLKSLCSKGYIFESDVSHGRGKYYVLNYDMILGIEADYAYAKAEAAYLNNKADGVNTNADGINTNAAYANTNAYDEGNDKSNNAAYANAKAAFANTNSDYVNTKTDYANTNAAYINTEADYANTQQSITYQEHINNSIKNEQELRKKLLTKTIGNVANATYTKLTSDANASANASASASEVSTHSYRYPILNVDVDINANNSRSNNATNNNPIYPTLIDNSNKQIYSGVSPQQPTQAEEDVVRRPIRYY